MYKIVNIKEGFPDSQYATFLLEREIDYAKKEGVKVLVFVHGYGSHGVGGVIKQKVKSKLNELKKKSVIECYILGENWSDLSEDVQKIYKYAPELSVSSQLIGINSGVSVVLVEK
ncbi:MAG: hypothetical protein IJA61_02770 [Clostridia bacterium]|nr:hypothetical protein [Clostridia bacterium]